MSSPPAWQPIYGQCGQCQQSAALDVDLSAHPHVAGKIGVRCTRCGMSSVYNFYLTPDAEIARQAGHKATAMKADTSGLLGNPWELVHLAQLGLAPQPKEGDEEPWGPDAKTLTHWKAWRLGGRGPLDRIETEDEHDHDDTRGIDEPDWFDLAGLGGDHRPGCQGD